VSGACIDNSAISHLLPGRAAGAGDYADLAALGVKTVINLTSDDALAEEPTWSRRRA
jgi:hypothetical protein